MSKKKETLKIRRNSKDSEKQKLERLQNAIAEVNSWKDKKPEVSFINFMYLMNYAEIHNCECYNLNPPPLEE